MPLLTATEVREHVETDLIDSALQRLIDDADQEIIDRLGVLASQTEVLDGGDALLHLQRKASSISSVVERILETDYTLASTDYQLLSDSRRLERLQGSGYPRLKWQGRVTVVYVPVDETAARKRLLVDLVRLAAQYDAKRGASIGDARVDNLDFEQERNKLFLPFFSRNRRMRLA